MGGVVLQTKRKQTQPGKGPNNLGRKQSGKGPGTLERNSQGEDPRTLEENIKGGGVDPK